LRPPGRHGGPARPPYARTSPDPRARPAVRRRESLRERPLAVLVGAVSALARGAEVDRGGVSLPAGQRRPPSARAWCAEGSMPCGGQPKAPSSVEDWGLARGGRRVV